MSDRFDDNSYLTAYDHNYRAAYAEGVAYLDEGASPKRELKRLASLLERTSLLAPGTRLLDLGCGDGTKGIFLAGLRVVHQRVFGRDRDKAAFVLRKSAS